MKVRVQKLREGEGYWYGEHIGEDFEVVCENHEEDKILELVTIDNQEPPIFFMDFDPSFVVKIPTDTWGIILKEDCEIVDEIVSWEDVSKVFEEDIVQEPEYTGASVSYYKIPVDAPISGAEPYVAECIDIIEALDLSFAEGNVLKSLVRRAVARKFGLAKKGYVDGLYDAEKMVFFSERVLKKEQQ